LKGSAGNEFYALACPDPLELADLARNKMNFDLQTAQSCSEIPACRGPEVLAIVIEVDPILEKEPEEYSYPKEYPERVEKFCRNLIWRKITGEITAEFLEAAVDRMFNADEVTSVVDLLKLQRLKRQVVDLFLTR